MDDDAILDYWLAELRAGGTGSGPSIAIAGKYKRYSSAPEKPL